MTLKNIIYSLLTSATTIGLITYFIKKNYDKKLEKKLAEYREVVRRKGNVFDKQFNTYEFIVGMVYRLRNKAKDIFTLFESKQIDNNKIEDYRRGLKIYNEALIEMLYDKRILIPDNDFNLIHESKNLINSIDVKLIAIRKTIVENNNIELIELINSFKMQYNDVDALYNRITTSLQKSMLV